jgi:hypothetical protein
MEGRKMQEYVGIDYGHGVVNIDHETGIRYGIIPGRDVAYWYDESEPYYGEEAEKHWASEEHEDCWGCPFDAADPLSFSVDTEEITAEGGSGGCGDIFVIKSRYFTYAAFCSPCAPGACYLLSPIDVNPNNKAYCFGPDWFEKEPPYPIYSVKTGKKVV